MESFEPRTCLRCEAELSEAGQANACSHGCTFCNACHAALDAVCPNCGGRLIPLSDPA